MDSVKQYLSGFRVPDLKKLWSDDPPRVVSKPLLLQFEATVVKLQELSLWTDPKSSVMALAAVHLVYWYLSVTTNTPIYLLVSTAILTFVYTTWTQRIWPEIRVPEADPGPEPDWTPVSPDVLSAPELVRLCDDLKLKLNQGLDTLKAMRAEQPGKFCGLVSAFFVLVAFLGSYASSLGLLYFLSVSYLTIPGVIKILVKYPAVQNMLQIMEEYNRKPEPEPAPMTQEKPHQNTLSENVYASLQSGFNAVSSFNLKAGLAGLTSAEDDFIPEEDEASQAILESAITSSTRDPTQAHSFDQDEVADASLEYASLLPVQGDVMPDDEMDGNQMPSLVSTTEEDEFLPSKGSNNFHEKSLAKLDDEDDEEEDEFTASLVAATKGKKAIVAEPTSVIRRRGKSAESDSDDFELISEEELAQVSP